MIDISEKIERWHKGEGDGLSLHEFLGMNFRDYGNWVMGKLNKEELAKYGYFEDS